MAHKFTGEESGNAYTVMAWVSCSNNGGSWANIWHLSGLATKDTPRNPALWLNMGGRYIHSCFTNAGKTNGNLYFNSATALAWDTWYHIT